MPSLPGNGSPAKFRDDLVMARLIGGELLFEALDVGVAVTVFRD